MDEPWSNTPRATHPPSSEAVRHIQRAVHRLSSAGVLGVAGEGTDVARLQYFESERRLWLLHSKHLEVDEQRFCRSFYQGIVDVSDQLLVRPDGRSVPEVS